MLTLPPEIMTILKPFMQAFSVRIWDWAQVLLGGAILAPGKRSVTAALQAMGLKNEKQYQNNHRVLDRVRLSGLQVRRILSGLFSMVTLLAHHLSQGISFPVRATAWFVKTKPGFSDAIALARYQLWNNMKFVKSPAERRFHVILNSMLHGPIGTICYAT